MLHYYGVSLKVITMVNILVEYDLKTIDVLAKLDLTYASGKFIKYICYITLTPSTIFFNCFYSPIPLSKNEHNECLIEQALEILS